MKMGIGRCWDRHSGPCGVIIDPWRTEGALAMGQGFMTTNALRSPSILIVVVGFKAEICSAVHPPRIRDFWSLAHLQFNQDTSAASARLLFASPIPYLAVLHPFPRRRRLRPNVRCGRPPPPSGYKPKQGRIHRRFRVEGEERETGLVIHLSSLDTDFLSSLPRFPLKDCAAPPLLVDVDADLRRSPCLLYPQAALRLPSQEAPTLAGSGILERVSQTCRWGVSSLNDRRPGVKGSSSNPSIQRPRPFRTAKQQHLGIPLSTRSYSSTFPPTTISTTKCYEGDLGQSWCGSGSGTLSLFLHFPSV
ncbi:hypothetical protein NMY22_g18061 [Coprinellus aureogranulatus]|nr:hypothetical protein NMY22_g18061 [Coprinellus aureogranulatus]